MTLQDDDLDRLVTVCDECLKASCWRGVFMCDRARGADVVQKTVRELLALGLEHPDYFAVDEVNYPEPAWRSVNKMTLQEIEDLWDLARVIHEARIRRAWGPNSTREPWPRFDRAYAHNPIAYVDLALASAGAVKNFMAVDVRWRLGPAMREVEM